jgi:hypothetical protein
VEVLRGLNLREDYRLFLSGQLHPLRFHINSIDRLAGGDKEAVALDTAKAEIGDDFRQMDFANQVTIRRKDVDTIVATPPCVTPPYL